MVKPLLVSGVCGLQGFAWSLALPATDPLTILEFQHMFELQSSRTLAPAHEFMVARTAVLSIRFGKNAQVCLPTRPCPLAGAEEIKAHPFFRGLNFALQRNEPPPYIPRREPKPSTPSAAAAPSAPL